MGAGMQRTRIAALASQGKSPIHACTPAQKRAFEMISIGQEPRCRPQVIKALEDAGLIEACGQRVICRDRFGVVAVPVYQIPLHVHVRWCAWCDANVTDEELATT